MSNIEDRENELWGNEAKRAERIIDWFELLIKLRNAAGAGVDAQPLIEQLLRADPDQMHESYLWMIDILFKRFELERDDLERRKNQRRTYDCPYTQAEYDAAVAKVGTVQKTLAHALNVSRNTLAKYGRPAD